MAAMKDKEIIIFFQELSLSAFLTDTPVKKPPEHQLLCESSRDSLARGLDVSCPH